MRELQNGMKRALKPTFPTFDDVAGQAASTQHELTPMSDQYHILTTEASLKRPCPCFLDAVLTSLGSNQQTQI